MTQEEKFEEAKRLYETANADQRYVLESLFPELRESEDERIIGIIRSTLESYNRGIIFDSLNAKDYADCLAWLEKQAQKPAAWSEEDARLLDNCISLIEDIDCTGEEQNWLKSLKDRVQPQPQWKPSDEQMKALEESIMFLGTSWVSTRQFALESLYQELKKLKDE